MHELIFKKLKQLLPALFLCTAALAGCASPSETSGRITGFYFDTVISVTIYDKDPDPLLKACMELAKNYEDLLSPETKGSDIWNINHSGGAFVTVSEDTLSLLNTALSYARLSKGLVDPTIGGLSQLWNFGSSSQGIVPEKAEIDQALRHIDYKNIIIEGRQVKLSDPHAQLELGFIAKGFIADKMKELLISRGVSSALINLGGNVLTLGNRPDGRPFRIGIQKPFEKSGTSALTLELSDISAVSSGNYERYFEKEGRLYHHILSTATGYPVDSGLSQVTILSPSSTDGDALSTLCFILGYEKAASLLKSYPDIRAVFITTDGRILYANFDGS